MSRCENSLIFGFDKLKQSDIDLLKTDAIDWAVSNGLLHRVCISDTKPEYYAHQPFALLPTFLISENEYIQLLELSKIFHKLMDGICRCPNILINCLSNAGEIDPQLTGKSLEIYKKCYGTGTNINSNLCKQNYFLGFFRNDLMRNKRLKNNWKNNKEWPWIQIEINSMSPSCAYLSDKINELHLYLLRKYQTSLLKDIYDKYYNKIKNCQLILNKNNQGYCYGLYKACKIVEEMVNVNYIQQDMNNKNGSNGVVLMVIHSTEDNICDQKAIEYLLLNKYNIKMIRHTFEYILNNYRYNSKNGYFYVNDEFISVIYFRTGYLPCHYENDSGESNSIWELRLIMEKSICIKCPNIGYHLIGNKIMQAKFLDKNLLSKFLNNDEISIIWKYFTKIETLSDLLNNNNKYKSLYFTLNDVRLNNANYVLKHTQRAGGCGIYFNKDIVSFIDSIESKIESKNDALEDDQSNAYIVMKRVKPESQNIIQIRENKDYKVNGDCEVGIFSVCLSNGTDKNNIIINKSIGTLVRSKPSNLNVCSITKGAVFDSILVYNINHYAQTRTIKRVHSHAYDGHRIDKFTHVDTGAHLLKSHL